MFYEEELSEALWIQLVHHITYVLKKEKLMPRLSIDTSVHLINFIFLQSNCYLEYLKIFLNSNFDFE